MSSHAGTSKSSAAHLAAIQKYHHCTSASSACDRPHRIPLALSPMATHAVAPEVATTKTMPAGQTPWPVKL
jgi:hypothetical protein